MAVLYSVSLPFFQKAQPDLERLITDSAEIGFEVWLRDQSFPEVVELAAQYKLTISLFPGSTLGFTNPDERTLVEQQLKDSIQAAADFRVPSVIVFSGNRQEGQKEIDSSQELNCRAISAAIRKTDYSGFIGHEFRPLGDAKEALRNAFSICR